MKIEDKITNKTPVELTQIIYFLQKELEEKDQKIESLNYRIDLLLRQRYCSRSEKTDPNHPQARLFDEAELPTENKSIETVEEKITVPSHQRKKTGRKPLPLDLPRERREYDIDESLKTCGCGSKLSCIGEDISEQLEVIPMQMFVIEHVRKKYACKSCEETIITAQSPRKAIPKSMAAPGLLSHVLVSKFCDHLPLYRQEKILGRIGIDITRGTLSNWVIQCGELLKPLVLKMKESIQNYDVAYADETTLQVLKEPGRKPQSKSYMWVFGGGPPEAFSWVYKYHSTRSGDVAEEFFENFQGFVHTDGYAGYHALKIMNIKLVGCFAHARRKFFEASKISKKKGLSHWAIEHIKKLYAIEKFAKENLLTPDKIKLLRLEKSKPLLDEFEVWLVENAKKTPPQSPIGKAIAYCLNQWDKLSTYLQDPRLEVDNNKTERAIKPFVIGRKNWLFADNVRGAQAASYIFSLIETCKVHQIEPYAYLRYVLTKLPLISQKEISELLPFNCDRNVINIQWRTAKNI